MASPPPADNTFHLFPLLPLEIRRMIWEFCLPYRVVEIDDPPHQCEWKPPRVCTLDTTRTTNTRPPAISRVSHEAREVAFRHGGVYGVVTGKGEKLEKDPKQPYYWQYNFSNPWIQPGRDVLHLHWTPGRNFNEVNWNPDNPEGALALLHYLAPKMRAPAVSIMAEVVLPFRAGWVDIVSLGDVDAMEVLSKWEEYMVVIEMVSIHVRLDVATLSGLFGVGGDERVKLVDPDDWGSMEEYGRLWRVYGSAQDAEAAEFFGSIADRTRFTARVEKWRQDLVKVWIWDQWMSCRWREDLPVERVWRGRNRGNNSPGGSPSWDPGNRRRWEIDMDVTEPNDEEPWVRMKKESMPRFQPKIMFRLCGRECYLPEEERPRLRWRYPSLGRRTPPWPPGWPPRRESTG